ncbi:hypothetical protein C8R43DRAFT_313006 [Mycena crocata]|nr:hypothetical protein C8R43DRAFT_313006 [Mycena crocata]
MSSAHLDAPVEDVPVAIPELIAVAPGPPQASPPLRRCYSLPEGWVFSKFTVIKTPSPPPSPSPPPKPKPKHKIYNIPEAAISSVESLPAPLQSGHAFLQNQKQLKAKVKTRAGNDAAAHAPEPTQVPGVPFTRSRTGESFRRPSMLSSIAETPAARWITKIAIKGKATGDRVRTLFKGRDLAWKDFIKVMKELGFSAEPLPDGNSMRFNPPDRRYPSVVFKRRT